MVHFSRSNFLLLILALACIAPGCKKKPRDVQGLILTSIRGSVDVTDNMNIKRTLASAALYTRDAILMPGYSVKTRSDTQVDMDFSESVRLRVGEDTSMRLETARCLKHKGYARLQLRLDSGKIYSVGKKISSSSRITIITPTSVVGVRGTEFMVREEKGKSVTLVREGSVEVSDEALNVIKIVEADQKAEIDSNGEIQVVPQTDEDRKEVQNLGADIATITESGREQMQNLVDQFEEQKVLIQQTLEEQEKINTANMEQQKEQDKDLIKNQIESDRQSLKEQIERDRANMEEMRQKLQAESTQLQQAGKEDQSKIQSEGKEGINQIKQNSPVGTQDATKAELEKLKNPQ
ncbi:MAG: FecR domain-containing protein [Leptospirales bacterium]|nr:FecR domain-containing protein [Leptospirales bacterium]